MRLNAIRAGRPRVAAPSPVSRPGRVRDRKGLPSVSAMVSSWPLLSMAGIASGIAVALHAQRQARERRRYERIAGLLLAGGLILVGFGLPVFR